LFARQILREKNNEKFIFFALLDPFGPGFRLAFSAYCLCSFPGDSTYRVDPTDLDQQPSSNLAAPAIAPYIDA